MARTKITRGGQRRRRFRMWNPPSKEALVEREQSENAGVNTPGPKAEISPDTSDMSRIKVRRAVGAQEGILAHRILQESPRTEAAIALRSLFGRQGPGKRTRSGMHIWAKGSDTSERAESTKDEVHDQEGDLVPKTSRFSD